MTDSQTAPRRDFLTYALSLLRADSAEHADSLPVLDVSALRHVAYALDAFVCYMRSGADASTWPSGAAPGVPPAPAPQSGRHHTFFRRSDSTTFLGCPPADPFDRPLVDSLPLADRPQLLLPAARREDLFGPAPRAAPPAPGHAAEYFDRLPTRLALSARVATPAGGGAAGAATASVIVRPAATAAATQASVIVHAGPATQAAPPGGAAGKQDAADGDQPTATFAVGEPEPSDIADDAPDGSTATPDGQR